MRQSILFITCTIFLSTACQNSTSVTLNAATYEQVLHTLAVSNENTRQNLEMNLREGIELLYDPAKFKYWPIREGILSVEANLEEFEERRTEIIDIKKNEKPPKKTFDTIRFEELVDFSKSKNEEVLVFYKELLKEYADTFGLHERDVAALNTDLEKELNRLDRKLIPAITTNKEDIGDHSMQLLLLESYFLFAQNNLSEYMLILASGTGCSWGPAFFPVVASNQACYNLGDSLQAQISIGSYSTEYHPGYVIMIVNKDTLKFQNDGTVLFEQFVNKRGTNVIEIECQVINPYTGDISVGKSEYIYEVR